MINIDRMLIENNVIVTVTYSSSSNKVDKELLKDLLCKKKSVIYTKQKLSYNCVGVNDS
jgi:hypothetical protein